MQVSARIASLPLKEPFVIARETMTDAEVVWVEIEHDGVTGYGEGAPIERYEESGESALAYIEEVADTLGDDPFAFDEITARTPRCTTSAASLRASRSTGSSASGGRARAARGRSGSASPTRRPARRNASRSSRASS